MRSFAIALTLLATIVGVFAGAVSWNAPTQGSSFAVGGPVTLQWLWLPNGSGVNAQGTDQIDVVLVDTRAGANVGVPVGGSLGKAPLAAGSLTVQIPANVVAGPSFTFRCQVGSTTDFIYTPQFALTGGSAAPANGTAPAPAAGTTVAAPIPATTTAAPAATTTAAAATTSKAAASATPTAQGSGAEKILPGVIAAAAIAGAVVAAL
ncbi:hypothetical protein HDV00_001657 [Rhizophlyctis rosea]|nr:hypothetical protein HDV00_001657 [Rhizophlyctis rosea]